MGSADALPLSIVACDRMTPAQKYDALEALRFRSRKGELNFRRGTPTVAEYCRFVMEQAGTPVLYEDAKLVQAEAQAREERNSYLRASARTDSPEMLLRAAASEEMSSNPAELLRASRDPS
jgi:hypothetical protein